jgi:hypothetical protein
MNYSLCPHCRESFVEDQLAEHDKRRLLQLLLDGQLNMARAELCATGKSEADALAWIEHFESCVGSWPVDPEDRPVIAVIDKAFGEVERPTHFTDFAHCQECADDATLLARPRERLRRKDLGTSGWDPVTFTSAQGLAYLMPTLARFAFAPGGRKCGWYGDQLAWHLSCDGCANRLFQACTVVQRSAVRILVEHLVAGRSKVISENCCEREYSEALEVWQGET